MERALSDRTVYRLSPLRLWVVPAISVAFAIFLFVLSLSNTGTPETRNIAFYMGIASIAFGFVMLLILRRTRLECSPNGVELHQFGYKLETDWDNVAHLHDGPGPRGLVLHRPMNSVGARTLADHRDVRINNTNFYTDEQIRLLAEQRFVPIDAFAHSLSRGQLRSDLLRYAPGIRANYREA